MGQSTIVTTGTKEAKLQAKHADEVYCAAWAIVLARHGGFSAASEVSFGYAVGTTKGKTARPVRLSLTAETEIGSFIDEMRSALKSLSDGEDGNSSSESTSDSAPFSSTLNIGSMAAPCDKASEAAVNIFCFKGSDGMAIRAHSDEAVVSSLRLEILLAHFRQALVQVTESPGSTPLGEIYLFSTADARHLSRWNNQSPEGVDETLCGLFSRRALSQPSAPAVCSWDYDLTYAELDQMSERLAGDLMCRGVQTEHVVALCFDKAATAVVAMLAVLRAGAAFMHLGVGNPPQRQAAMLSACKSRLVLCDASSSSRVCQGNVDIAAEVLVIDRQFISGLAPVQTPLPIVVSTS